MKLFLFFASLLALSVASPAAAQGSSVPAPLTFRIISACGSRGDLLYDLKNGSGVKTQVKVTLNQSLSAPYPRPSGDKLVLYREVPPPPDAPAGTPPTRQTIVTAELPSGLPDCIVVTVPRTTDRLGPLASRVIPGTPETHQAGTVKLINFSEHETAVALDERTITLPPGSIQITKFDAGRILVQVAVQKAQGWTPAFRGERLSSPAVRGYIFIFNYMEDPDYGPDPTPPPALVNTLFEVTPEAALRLLSAMR